MSSALDINTYSFSNTDILFFDTNIWYLIYGPQGSGKDPRIGIYSNALKRALLARSRILVDVLIISEFVNRFARTEYDIQDPDKKTYPDFKKYRESSDFCLVAQTIVAETRKILGFATRIESGFTAIDIDSLLTEYENGGYDFNDQILLRLCMAQSFKLVTDDTDLKGKGVDILSANQRILY